MLIAAERLLGRWRLKGEILAADVVAADSERTLLAQRLRVRARDGRTLQLKSNEAAHVDRIVALIQSLVAGGRP